MISACLFVGFLVSPGHRNEKQPVMKIRQALFGYRDGHNLIAASTSIASRERLLLAKITDSTGPGDIAGFETSISGRPVNDLGYVIFRTWKAPEMPRPGCVWSHVLIIDYNDLKFIENLSQLIGFFVRPDSTLDMSFYKSDLELRDNARERNALLDSNAIFRIRALLGAFYGHPDEDIVILDEESTGWEEVIFALWSQQWLSLRSKFSFSTASLGDRRIGGGDCMVQVAPVSKGRFWRKSPSSTLICELGGFVRNVEVASKTSWSEVAIKDITSRSELLSEFFKQWCCDIDPRRSLFQPLVEIYMEINAKGVGRLRNLQLVGQLFPDRSQATVLKENLLGDFPVDSSKCSKLLLENVEFLLCCKESEAYSLDSLDFSAVVASLWDWQRPEFLDLLTRVATGFDIEPKHVFSDLLQSVSMVIGREGIVSLAATHAILVPAVISYNSKLAANVEIWCLTSDLQSKVIEALRGLQVSSREWASILGAMFVAGTTVGVRDSIDGSKSDLMLGVFQWLDNLISEEMLPSSHWRSALSDSVMHLFPNVDFKSPAEIALTAWLLPPWRVVGVVGIDLCFEKYFEEGAFEDLPRPLRIPTAFLMLALALRNGRVMANVPRCFFTVHEALAKGTYTQESWDMIAPYLPDLGFWWSWDRCERLRRAVSRYLDSNPYGRSYFINAAATDMERELVKLVIS